MRGLFKTHTQGNGKSCSVSKEPRLLGTSEFPYKAREKMTRKIKSRAWTKTALERNEPMKDPTPRGESLLITESILEPNGMGEGGNAFELVRTIRAKGKPQKEERLTARHNREVEDRPRSLLAA